MKTSGPLELLAPAANVEMALTAFDYGADAVYLGLKKFNARGRAENLTIETLSQLLAYARSVRRKVYVTFNTLLKETELEEAARLLADLADLGPDAVIVQDIGVARILREYFPSLTAHASTQMAIHNSDGVAAAARLGLRRVILERQVTYEELERIVAKSPIEIEVFVHGALCCSLSGVCLFSSWLGGQSGNRGRCKQPCRRLFRSEKGGGFYFSPKDLRALEAIPFLRKAGVASLKIEGRLRRPDYVRAVVSAYRAVLDAPEGGEADAMAAAARVLDRSACGRSWRSGFQTPRDFQTMIASDRLGISGSKVGQVVRVTKDGFFARFQYPVGIGDRLRAQAELGKEGPALTLSRLFADDKPVRQTVKGRLYFIPCDEAIPADGALYKIGEAWKSLRRRIAALTPLRERLDLRMRIAADGVRVEVLNAVTPETWHWPSSYSEAEARPLTLEMVETAFRSGDQARFEAGQLSVTIDGRLFVPLSELKTLRRAFWEWAETRFGEQPPPGPGKTGLARFLEARAVPPRPFSEKPRVTVLLKEAGPSPIPDARVCVPLDRWKPRAADEALLPLFCPETALEETRRQIQAAYDAGCRRFRVTSLYGLESLRNLADIERTVSFPLPICNAAAVAEARALGASDVQAWVELGQGDLAALVAAGGPLEIFSYGRLPILITRAVLPVRGTIADDRDAKFTVTRDENAQLTLIYPEKTLSLPESTGERRFMDLTSPAVKTTTTFNFNDGFQ